ncbi:PQQ-binding-like beta-propeller repeat protein [Haloarcula sp. JP-L23]|uniref:outer membrane protein assembly factor BamB family protein n=1 Tax=Haloarcula sp. JP-L23 TaxID=2716717 RepID=UPI00140EEFF9|nr:PQQ-binding-like beta-propeller repeat protein [Haloarcula sp. JP-L23]
MSDAPERKLLALSVAVLAVFAIPAGLLAPVGSASAVGNAAGNWQTFQFDQQNTGNASDAPDYASVTSGWRAGNQGTDVASGPTVSGDTVYVGDGSAVKAYAEGDGSLSWETSVDGPVFGSPAYDGGSVYVATDGGSVYALDAATGAVTWQRSTDSNGADFGSFAGSVTVGDGGSLYVASEDGHVYKLSNDGTQVSAAYDMGSPAGAMTPAVYGDRVYVGDRSGTLHMLSAGDLSAQSTNDVTSGALNSPAVTEDGQRIVVTASDGTVAAYDTDGNQQWADTSSYGSSFASPAIHKGVAVVGTTDGTVAAHDIDSSGSQQWTATVDTKNTFGASVTTANGTVFVGTDTGDVSLLDASDGSTKARATAASSAMATAPTVADDALYVGTDDGAVVQFLDANAAFSVTSISAPGGVTEGDIGTVEADVSNAGTADGTYTARLTVDGQVVDTERVSIAKGSSKTVTFDHKFVTVGYPTVSVGSQSTTITVASGSSSGGGGGGSDSGDDPTTTETSTPEGTDATATPAEPDDGDGSETTATATTEGSTATEAVTDTPESTGTASTDTPDSTDQNEGSDDGGDEEATSGSGPGFTAAIALLAVVAATLLAARREN